MTGIMSTLKQASKSASWQIVVVGAGFSGAVIARQITDTFPNAKVRIVERRDHIAGNMYDYTDERGILIQKYGPHFFNTNKYALIKFIKQYTDWFAYNMHGMSVIDGKYITLPYNFQTVRELVGEAASERVYAKLRIDYVGRDRVTMLELLENSDADVSTFANRLFDKAYKTYTSKMWDVPVDKIDRYVLDRVPVRLGYDERYLMSDFQYLPVRGFTELFENLLKHPNITVELNTDALLHILFAENTILYDGTNIDCLVFSGNIDELFNNQFGKLPYRSLEFEYRSYDERSHLPREVVYYPQADGYTRDTEYRKIMFDDNKANGTTIVREFPLNYDKESKRGNIPYYPVVTEESNAIYAKYRKLSEKYKNLFLCGRLAEFKYYNMDICLEHALEYSENIKSYLEDNAE
jgi:UDP-galactopyranose mutase